MSRIASTLSIQSCQDHQDLNHGNYKYVGKSLFLYLKPWTTFSLTSAIPFYLQGLAKRVKAKILLTSTSEIYGDPKVHPQPESYWGNVNTSKCSAKPEFHPFSIQPNVN